MSFKKGFPFILGFLCLQNIVSGQTLTGTWQGTINDHEYIQINIIEKEDKLCGYTYDYMSPESFCVANFTALYSKEKKVWYTESTSFIDNKGGHVLMQLQFKQVNKKGRVEIKGFCYSLSPTSGKPMAEAILSAKKVADSPATITLFMKDCGTDN